MVDKNLISRLLKKHFETTSEVTIDDQGLVSCNGDVTLKEQKEWKRLPVAFDKVGGDFWCNNNQLTTLEGAPTSVSGSFVCNNNQLTTLEGAPTSVGGSFWCSNNQLTSLEHAPISVDGNFLCSNNQLTSLEHAPKSVVGDFYCNNNQLTTLAGAPTSVGGEFECGNNQLTSLEHAPTSVDGNFGCMNNQLTSLRGLPAVQGTLWLSYSPTLPLLRCLLAKKVELRPNREDKTIENILNQYAGQGEAGAFACGAELATAGFKENARW